MILVTGGTGLVGSYLLKELVRLNKPVKALYRAAPTSLLT
ncbi:MAG TPA: NAD-dependent epimerase/dehydratase family protein, partial [Chitinophagaceae bacterium]